MVILHYIPSIDEDSGGVGVYIQQLSRELGMLCTLHVVTHKSARMRMLENCHLHFIPELVNPFGSMGKCEFICLLDKLKPDIFHTNCCWRPMSALTAIWAKEKGLKVVYSPHGMLEPWIMKRNYWTKKLPALLLFQRKGIACADLLHSTADSEKNNLLVLGWNRRITVIPNCIQIDQITMKEPTECHKRILFLSRIHPKKGIEFLLSSIAALKKQLKGYTVTIAGSGEKSYVAALLDMSKKLEIDHIVSFVGPVSGKNKFQLYRESDLFILPTFSENFGIVVAEALASGVPVITTSGTPWEELETNHCGWWIPIGSDSLIKSIKEFLATSQEDLLQMGINGRKLVENKYSSFIVAKQFFEMYQLLKNNNNVVRLT